MQALRQQIDWTYVLGFCSMMNPPQLYYRMPMQVSYMRSAALCIGRISSCSLPLGQIKLQFYKKYIILTSKKMKTPKFILNRTEDYLYHSKLWIIGYASLFYLCSIIIFSMLLTFCVFIYNCIGLDPETMTNFGGRSYIPKKE